MSASQEAVGGTLTSTRLIPAAWGPARGSRSGATISGVGGARSAGCGPCRRGWWRAESAALRVRGAIAAAAAASSVGSRRTEPPGAPHMLLINIHHYIMGLAGSARAGGEEPGRRRRRHAGESGEDPRARRAAGWGEGRIPKPGP